MPAPPRRRLRTANDEFQLLRALLTNRNKRHRQGRFLVQGVRPVQMAIGAGWPLEALLVVAGPRSSWADELVESAPVDEVIELPEALIGELSERDEGAEVLLVALAPDRPAPVDPTRPVVVAEGLSSPGNLGSIVRSADALGAGGVVVTGHAADPFDPRCVRASTGSIFTVPVWTAESVAEAVDALGTARVVGLDEDGDSIDDVDLAAPVALVAGNETTGMSRRARERCDTVACVPMVGSASSLNVATAVGIVLAEIGRRARAGV